MMNTLPSIVIAGAIGAVLLPGIIYIANVSGVVGVYPMTFANLEIEYTTPMTYAIGFVTGALIQTILRVTKIS